MRILDAPTWIKLGFSAALLAVASMALIPLMPAVSFANTTCTEDADCDDDEYCSQWGVCEPNNPFGGEGGGDDDDDDGSGLGCFLCHAACQAAPWYTRFHCTAGCNLAFC